MKQYEYPIRIKQIKSKAFSALMRGIYRDVHQNHFGFFGAFTGEPGAGKSETALLVAWLQDKDFDEYTIEQKYFFSPRDFMRTVNEANKHEWLIWDETGTSVALSSKNWYKMTNTLIEDVIQTIRVKELGIIFITQSLSFVDNRARSLFRWLVVVKRWQAKSPETHWYRIKIDQLHNKIMYRLPFVKMGNKMYKLRRVIIKDRLPEPIRNRFEEIHREWKEKLWQRHYRTIAALDETAASAMSLQDIIDKILSDPGRYQKDWHGRKLWDKNLIMYEFGIGRSKADQIISVLRARKKDVQT